MEEEKKVQIQSGSIVDKAEEAAKKLESENNKLQENLNKLEDLYARMRLGGGSMAGSMPQSAEDLKNVEAKRRADEIVKAFK